MQDFYKGQKFYYIDSRTHRKVYITLIAIKDDTLYFEGLNKQKYAVKKYYVNRTVFISLLDEKPKSNPKKNSKKAFDSRPMYSNGNLDEDLGKYSNINCKPRKRKKNAKKKVNVPLASDLVMPAYTPSKYAGNHHRSAPPRGQSSKAIKRYEDLGKPGLQKEDDWSKYDYKIGK